jgi:hypothetical protein
MVIDISVVQNGKVATFFKVDSDIKNIDFINFMSSYILITNFNSNFKNNNDIKFVTLLPFNNNL